MTSGREIARGEKGAKVVYQERSSSRGSTRVKAAGMGETIPPALRSTGSVPRSAQSIKFLTNYCKPLRKLIRPQYTGAHFYSTIFTLWYMRKLVMYV